MNPVALEPEDLTPEWVTWALRESGHDTTVTSCRAEPIGTGQMGRSYRLHLATDPGTLVAKIAGPDPELRALVGPGYAAEVGFYTDLVDDLDVVVPGCWYGAFDEASSSFTLLLDDGAPAVPGVQADGCSVEQARGAIANLVGLHAPRWDDPTLRDTGYLMPTDGDTASGMASVLGPATETFVERFADRLTADEVATLRAAAEAIADWQLTRTGHFSVIHGDYRLDNLLFGPDGSVIALDWQTAGVGPALRDVAYFCGTSLGVEDRRANEEALVAEYHDGLVAAGVDGYSADDCWLDYRLGQLQGPLIGVVGCAYASGEQSESSDAMFLAMITRSCAAIRDLATLQLV